MEQQIKIEKCVKVKMFLEISLWKKISPLNSEMFQPFQFISVTVVYKNQKKKILTKNAFP